MLTKEESKTYREEFWKGFRKYCGRKKINRKWVLTGVKIKSTQLKFYADNKKALVLFQIDHKNDLRRYEIYEHFLGYRKLFREACGDELIWEEDYDGIEDRRVSAIYFLLNDVSLYRKTDWDKIYDFFIKKMTLLEDLYWEYRDVIVEDIKRGDEK